MAITLQTKPSSATYYYTWRPDLVDGDSISSFTLLPDTVVVETSENASKEVRFYLSGGTTGSVHTIAGTITTSDGETLKETLYVPISGPGNTFSETADDVIDFALRPVVGLSGTRTTAETNDALEHLNEMLSEWSITGANVNIPLPMTTTSVLYCSDAFVRAIKNNLRVYVAEQYGQQVSPATGMAALRGLQAIKNDNLRGREAISAAEDY